MIDGNDVCRYTIKYELGAYKSLWHSFAAKCDGWKLNLLHWQIGIVKSCDDRIVDPVNVCRGTPEEDRRYAAA